MTVSVVPSNISGGAQVGTYNASVSIGANGQGFTIPVTLSVTREGADAAGDFGLKELLLPFSVKGKGTVSLYWAIAAPGGTAAYKVRAVARALADA